MVENFHLNLAAVGVSGKGKLDAEFGGAIEGIGIVGKKDVRHIAPYQRLDIRQRLDLLAARSALALIIDPDQIKWRTVEVKLDIFLTEKLHARLRKEHL